MVDPLSQPLAEPRSESAVETFLTVVEGPSRGRPVAVGKRATIGRSSRCDLTLASPLVSRVHAEVVRTSAGPVLRDLGSVNGTFVNGAKVAVATLRQGDRVGIGDFVIGVRFATSLDSAADSNVVLCATSEIRAGGSSSQLRMAIHEQAGGLPASVASGDAERAARASARLETLLGVTQRLARLRELDVLFPLIADEVLRVLPASRVVVFTMGEDGELAARAARNTEAPGTTVTVSRTILNEVCEQRLCILSGDAMLEAAFDAAESIMVQGIRAVLAVPIEFDGELLGALYLDAPGQEGVFSEEDLRFVSGLAGMVAVALTNSTALARAQAAAAELNHAYLSMLAVLANAIEARDHYTVGHTWRVARFAQVVARRLGWDEAKLAEIEVGGLLHDIGKIGVPDSILTKQGPLDADEQARMKLHPTIGARMLRDVPSLEHVLPYVLSHHENVDGSGYPDGLAGEAIPPEARLLAVVDAFDAMTSTRPYRRGMAVEVAVERLERAAGSQLDPTIVAALVAAWRAGELAPYLATEQQAQHQVPCPHCSTWFTPAPGSDANRCRCPTCHRQLRLVAEDGALRAELA